MDTANKINQVAAKVGLPQRKIYLLYKDDKIIGSGTKQEVTTSIAFREKIKYELIRVKVSEILAGKRKSYRGYTVKEQLIYEPTRVSLHKILLPYAHLIGATKTTAFKALKVSTSNVLNAMLQYAEFIGNEGERMLIDEIYSAFSNLYAEDDSLDLNSLEILCDICQYYDLTIEMEVMNEDGNKELKKYGIFDAELIRPALTNSFFAKTVREHVIPEKEEKIYCNWCRDIVTKIMQEMSITE